MCCWCYELVVQAADAPAGRGGTCTQAASDGEGGIFGRRSSPVHLCARITGSVCFVAAGCECGVQAHNTVQLLVGSAGLREGGARALDA